MNVLSSVTNVNVEKMIIATGFMAVAALGIFLRRHYKEHKGKTDE